MLLELNLGINGVNNKTNEIEEFTKELNNALQGDKVLIYYKSFNKVSNYNIAYVKDIDLEYGIIYVRQNIFGEDIIFKLGIVDVKKID